MDEQTVPVLDDKQVTKATRSKKRKLIAECTVYVNAGFNNTIVTFCDKGNKLELGSASAGGSGFKGSRKSTPFAAQVAAEKVGKLVHEKFEIKKIKIVFRGPGPGRDSVVRALAALKYYVSEVVDETPIPHNGCRPPKRRRV